MGFFYSSICSFSGVNLILKPTSSRSQSSNGSLGLGLLDKQTEDDMIGGIKAHARTIAEAGGVVGARGCLIASV